MQLISWGCFGCIIVHLKTLDVIDLIFLGNQLVTFVAFINELDDAMSRYKAAGIRLDSGDLAYLSGEARKIFRTIEKEFGVPGFGKTNITASNDLNEETLDALNKQVMILNLWGFYKVYSLWLQNCT